MDLTASFKRSDQLPPLVGLNMAYNQLIFGAEVLDNYYARWAVRVIGEAEVEKTLLENSERVALAMKVILIGILSAFEYAAKAEVAAPGSPIAFKPKEKIYLGGIMAKSAETGLCQELELWSFAVEMRNSLVHNNGIAAKNCSIQLEDGSTMLMERAVMMTASPRAYVQLMRQLCLAYSAWCRRILA